MKSIAMIFVLALFVSACGGDSGTSPTPAGQPPAGSIPYSATDLRVGTGTEATAGRVVAVNYTGWLYSTTATANNNKGTQFDTSIGRTPFVFTVGTGTITGFAQGVTGMRVGGQRRVVIPPNLGYGAQGSGTTIPPNATLIFELELLAVQ